MADKKLTELPEHTAFNDNDKGYIVDSLGNSKFARHSTLKGIFGEKNKDTILDEGGDDEVSAAEIRALLDTQDQSEEFTYDAEKSYNSVDGDSNTYAVYNTQYWQYINATATTEAERIIALGVGNGVPAENAYWTEVSKSDLDSIYNADLIKVGGKAYVQRFGALCFTASGTDTYTATTTVGPTVLNNKLRIWVRFTNANTGASTFNWNSLGAKAIVKNGSEALVAGDIKAGQILQIGYDDSGNWQIIGGGSGSSLTIANQTESETAADATTSASADNTKAASLRAVFWFWAKKISNWAFGSLTWSTSITWNFQSRYFSKKNLTATGTTTTITLSNTISGSEGELYVTLSGITSITITLAGSGLTFKRIDTGATITSLYFSGTDGQTAAFGFEVNGSTVYVIGLGDDPVIRNGGNTLGAKITIGTNDNQDFALERNGTEVLNLGSAGVTNTDHFKLTTAGKGFFIKEGTNAYMGVATLVAGTVTVSNSRVTANSRIFISIQSLGTVAAPKGIAITARTAGVSFTITSADATDTSIIAWEIKEPS